MSKACSLKIFFFLLYKEFAARRIKNTKPKKPMRWNYLKQLWIFFKILGDEPNVTKSHCVLYNTSYLKRPLRGNMSIAATAAEPYCAYRYCHQSRMSRSLTQKHTMVNTQNQLLRVLKFESLTTNVFQLLSYAFYIRSRNLRFLC